MTRTTTVASIAAQPSSSAKTTGGPSTKDPALGSEKIVSFAQLLEHPVPSDAGDSNEDDELKRHHDTSSRADGDDKPGLVTPMPLVASIETRPGTETAPTSRTTQTRPTTTPASEPSPPRSSGYAHPELAEVTDHHDAPAPPSTVLTNQDEGIQSPASSPTTTPTNATGDAQRSEVRDVSRFALTLSAELATIEAHQSTRASSHDVGSSPASVARKEGDGAHGLATSPASKAANATIKALPAAARNADLLHPNGTAVRLATRQLATTVISSDLSLPTQREPDRQGGDARLAPDAVEVPPAHVGSGRTPSVVDPIVTQLAGSGVSGADSHLGPATSVDPATGAPTPSDFVAANRSLTASISSPRAEGDGTYSVTATLNPPSLGHVQAVVKVDGMNVSVAIVAHSPVAHQALAEHLDELQRELGAHGGEVQLSLSDEPGNGQGRDEARQPFVPIEATDDPDSASPHLPTQAGSSLHVIL